MKTSKFLGILVAIVQVTSLAAFGLSFHTLTSVLTTTLSPQNINVELTIDEVTRTGELQFEVATGNQGFLTADLTLEVSAINLEGVRFASESSSVHLGPGTLEPLSLTLNMPSSEVERMISEGKGSKLEIVVTLRTLYDLVGFSNTLRLEGGEVA